ncbi:hypothetical protein FHS59_000707 [Algoriphagus iocasae]|uniref:DUF748 domain-containing protein n=1 Tax=Algoriphagus iocasae TaxID=1836499 RepID=A0A841MAT0_9BACT|nr:DUF748 domain-containing protein [Algoriphagus iocasae]MBB6325092.1 hypothetical protein [Algoriphagus iocasae]
MKKLGIGLLVLLVVGIAGTYYLEIWLGKRIPEVINANPDRNYDLQFEEIDIHLLKKGVELKKIMLVPLDDSLATKMNGSIRSIEMSGVDFLALIFNNKLEIGEIKLLEPAFRLIQRDRKSNANESSKAFQDLFKDLISRGVIKNFFLEKGTAEMFMDKDSLYRFGQFTDLTIVAHGIESDSLIAKNVIPFKLESIATSLKNLKINTDTNQEFRIAEASYSSGKNIGTLKGISLKYNEGLDGARSKSEFQKDLIQLDIKEFELSQIDTESTIYGNWAIFAKLARIDSLVLEDLRDKNKPRPDEPIKPLFEGMVEAIPFPIKLDSIKVTNSTISYKEILQGKNEPIQLNFQEIQGSITNLVSSDSLQNQGSLLVDVTSVLNGFAPVKMKIDIPYGTKSFALDASIGSFNLTALNEIFEPMGKFRVESGTLRGLKLSMDANEKGSSNQLNFDYENLKLEIYKSDGQQRSKNGILSSVANLLTSKENLPGSKNYKISTHWTSRNPYRAPFHLIWISTKDGMMAIVPSGLGNIFMPDSKK